MMRLATYYLLLTTYYLLLTTFYLLLTILLTSRKDDATCLAEGKAKPTELDTRRHSGYA